MKNIKVLIRYPLILLLVLLISIPLIASGAESSREPALSQTNFPMVGTTEAQNYDLVFAVSGDSRSDHSWLNPAHNPNYELYINMNVLRALRDNLINIWKGSPGFFLMHVGDIGIRGGTPIFDVFEHLMAPMHAPDVNIPVYLAKGNHEVRYYVPSGEGSDPGHAEHPDKAILAQREYQKKFVNSWMMPGDAVFPKDYAGLAYYFIRGSSLFIVLDSYYVNADKHVYKKGYYSDFQLKWLQDTLIQHNSIPNKFVFSHQPAFDAAEGKGKFYVNYHELKSGRANWILWRLLDMYNVDAYFCGHSHFYHRWNIVGSKFQYTWNTDWDALGSDFNASNLQHYINTPTPWQNEIPQVINGTCGAPPQGFGPEHVPYEKKENVYNFSIVKVKGDTIAIDVYSYDTQTPPKLIDKLQKQNGKWKNIPIPANWVNDVEVNLPLAVSPGNQQHPKIVRDTSGNIFTGWLDYHARKVQVQKMDAGGNMLWQANGIPASPVIVQSLTDFEMEGDGQGGVYVTWNCSQMDLNSNETLETAENFNTNRLYAQRLNAQGQKQWSSPVRINDINHSMKKHSITTDGQNGIIVHWISDYPQPHGSAGDPEVLSVCVQRINLAGSRLWGNDGIQVFEPWDAGGYAYGSISEYHALTTSDGAGGAFLGFNFYSEGLHARNLEAIRINGNGQRTLGTQTSEGTKCGLNMSYGGSIHTPGDAAAIPSGDGGVIYAWQNNYFWDGFSADIYAQKVNAACAVAWPLREEYGVPVCTAESYGSGKLTDSSPDGLDLTSDGSGGAIITWEERRQMGRQNIYAQRINNLGNAVWARDGIYATRGQSYESEPRIISDNTGGAIISFLTNYGLQAQRLNANGNYLWIQGPKDVAIERKDVSDYSLTNRCTYHETVLHENGNVVAVWQDYRNTGEEIDTFTNVDVYTQFISRDASLVPTYTLTISKMGPGWVRGSTNPTEGSYIYPRGTLVTIKAISSGGSNFVNWTGDVDNASAAQTTVFIDADKTVTANFIPDAIAVVLPPTITSVNPASAYRGSTVSVTITGTNLSGATTVSFGSGIITNRFTVESPTQIRAGITVLNVAMVGRRDVIVTTPGGTASKYGVFGVLAPSSANITSSGGGGGGTTTTTTIPTPAPTLIPGVNNQTGSAIFEGYLDSQARTVGAIKVACGNGFSSLLIPQLTQVRDSSNNPLQYVQIAVKKSPPSPEPGYVIVGSIGYECTPNSSTFQPPITLSIAFSPTDIPSGVLKKDLFIAYWDGSKWNPLTPTPNADPNVNEVSTNDVSHFTTFAVIGKAAVPSMPTPAPTPSTSPAPLATPTTAATPIVGPTPTPTPSPSNIVVLSPSPTSSQSSSSEPPWILIGGGVGGFIIILLIVYLLLSRRRD